MRFADLAARLEQLEATTEIALIANNRRNRFTDRKPARSEVVRAQTHPSPAKSRDDPSADEVENALRKPAETK